MKLYKVIVTGLTDHPDEWEVAAHDVVWASQVVARHVDLRRAHAFEVYTSSLDVDPERYRDHVVHKKPVPGRLR